MFLAHEVKVAIPKSILIVNLSECNSRPKKPWWKRYVLHYFTAVITSALSRTVGFSVVFFVLDFCL
jgi:predicted RND superfamily exporter protein